MFSFLLFSTLLVAKQPVDWNDGLAEVNGYELVQPRYGELRRGTAVLIFVKEDFSQSARVKADPGQHPPADVFPVLKLNVLKSFQTGVYRYNLMTSVFTAFSTGAPTKIVFSNQEWCGAVFEELLFDEKSVRAARFSYFDGEGDEQRTLELHAGALTVDSLPIVVRQLQVPEKSREVLILPSLERTRLEHRKLAWERATLRRAEKTEKRKVPAGSFEVDVWTLELGGGDLYRYYVEHESPRRLIEWEGPEGERGRLTGSARQKYWELHKEGNERHLRELGLPAPR